MKWVFPLNIPQYFLSVHLYTISINDIPIFKSSPTDNETNEQIIKSIIILSEKLSINFYDLMLTIIKTSEKK